MEKMSQEEKQETLDRVEKKAAAYNYEYSGCAQMVILALQQEFKLPGGMGPFKAAAFCCRATLGVGGTCSALVGGIIALGMAAGRDHVEDPIWPNCNDVGETGFPKSVETVRRFYKRFEEELGSLECRQIQAKLLQRTYDWESWEAWKRFELEGGREARSKCVGKAARVAAEALLELPRR